MLLFFLLIISGPSIPVRTKINTVENNIKAYKLLERNKNQNSLDEIIIKEKIIEFIYPPTTLSYTPKKQAKSLYKALKMQKTLYWNEITKKIEYKN